MQPSIDYDDSQLFTPSSTSDSLLLPGSSWDEISPSSEVIFEQENQDSLESLRLSTLESLRLLFGEVTDDTQQPFTTNTFDLQRIKDLLNQSSRVRTILQRFVRVCAGKISAMTDINGTTYTIESKPQVFRIEDQVIYKKQDRSKTPMDQLNKVMSNFIRGGRIKPPIDFLSLSLDDGKSLQDTLSIQTTVNRIKSHITLYDCHDVFNIIINVDDLFDSSGNQISNWKPQTVNLFSHFQNVTLQQVADSN